MEFCGCDGGQWPLQRRRMSAHSAVNLGGGTFLEQCRKRRRRKRRQRSGQPSYHWNHTSKRNHERPHRLWQRTTSAKIVGRDPALTSRWHWTAAAASSQSVQAAKQAISSLSQPCPHPHRPRPPTFWENSSANVSKVDCAAVLQAFILKCEFSITSVEMLVDIYTDMGFLSPYIISFQ